MAGRPKNVATAARTGNTRETLVALRNSIAAAIDKTDSGRDIAALSKRLMEITEKLDSMPDPKAQKSALAIQQERASARKRGG